MNRDYLVSYRIFLHTHNKWGPQWRHDTDVVSVEGGIACREDIEAIAKSISDAQGRQRIEITCIVPCGGSV
jgi:hypothetical protein